MDSCIGNTVPAETEVSIRRWLYIIYTRNATRQGHRIDVFNNCTKVSKQHDMSVAKLYVCVQQQCEHWYTIIIQEGIGRHHAVTQNHILCVNMLL